MKTVISSAVVAAILATATLSSANADTPTNATAPAAKSHTQTAGKSLHPAQAKKTQPVNHTQKILNPSRPRALNPQPIPPGRALNPQPLPPG